MGAFDFNAWQALNQQSGQPQGGSYKGGVGALGAILGINFADAQGSQGPQGFLSKNIAGILPGMCGEERRGQGILAKFLAGLHDGLRNINQQTQIGGGPPIGGSSGGVDMGSMAPYAAGSQISAPQIGGGVDVGMPTSFVSMVGASRGGGMSIG